MSAPAEQHDRGLHVFDWDHPECVRLEFDLLRQDNRSGETSAEITVTSTLPGLEGHLHQARINLSSSPARATLAKTIAARTPGQELDWAGLLEVAVIRTLRAHRAGEPAFLLRDAVQPLETGHIVEPLALAGLPTTLFGDGASGKSAIALALGASIQAGQPYLGLPPTRTLNVAYLDWEMNGWEHRERLRAITDDDMPDVLYVPCGGPLREQVDRLRRIGREHGIGYWIVDSVAPACGGEPESAEVALAFHNALRALGGGALCVAHTTKAGDDSRPFGSTFWHNMARSTWLAKKQQDVDAATFTVALFNKKANTGPLHAPLAFELTFADGRIVIARADVRDIPELAATQPLWARIAHAVRTGAKTYADLATELDAEVEAVRKAADRGMKATRTGSPPLFTRVVGEDRVYRVGLLSHAA